MRSALPMLVVAACGSPDHAQVDAPLHGTDAAADARPIDAAVMRQGLVQLSKSTFANTTNASSTLAFADGDPMGATLATDGPCASYPMTGGARYSAGMIAVTGTSQALAFTPNGVAPSVTYTHTPASLPADVFAASATIHVVGAGGPDFGAFTGDVTGPDALAFTAPASLSRAGQTVTWTAGTSTIMQVAIVTQHALILCRVPDNGSFAVPASTFLLIPNGDTSGAIALGRTNETKLDTASGQVTLQAIVAVGGTITLGP